MSTRKESERTKFIQEKCLTMLTQMLRDEDNKYCVDCDAKGKDFVTQNLTSKFHCPNSYRSTMGIMESGCFSVYSLCWHP